MPTAGPCRWSFLSVQTGVRPAMNAALVATRAPSIKAADEAGTHLPTKRPIRSCGEGPRSLSLTDQGAGAPLRSVQMSDPTLVLSRPLGPGRPDPAAPGVRKGCP